MQTSRAFVSTPLGTFIARVVNAGSYDKEGFGLALLVHKLGKGASNEDMPARFTDAIVLFHKNNYCRAVIETGHLGFRAASVKAPQVSTHPDNPSVLVMRVNDGSYGLTASAWGLVPPRDWRHKLIEAGGLKGYIGSEVTSDRARGQSFPGPEYKGILAHVSLTVDKILLVLSEPRLRGTDGIYRPMGQADLTLTYPLGNAKRVGASSGHVIEIPEPGSDRPGRYLRRLRFGRSG